MTGRKQAQRLDDLLSGGSFHSPALDRPAAEPTPELAHLVRTAEAVRTVSPVGRGVDPAFAQALRQRLDAEASQLAPARAQAAHASRARTARAAAGRRSEAAARRGTGRRRPVVLAALVASTVALGTATSVASSAALPGDLLYPVKRSAEGARLLVSRNDAARGTVTLDLARERLGETWRLAAAEHPDQQALEAVLDELGSGATDGVTQLLREFDAGGDPAALAEIASFLVTAIPAMRGLRGMLPPALRAAAETLVQQWVAVEGAVVEVVESCGAPCDGVVI